MLLQEYTREIEKLLHCVTMLQEKNSDVKPSTPTTKDVALNGLMMWLGHAWFVVFGQVPGTTVKADGTVCGPFIDFVCAALEPLLEELPTDKALRKRIRDNLPSVRGRAKSKTL